jgi:signal transduction histidine kinase
VYKRQARATFTAVRDRWGRTAHACVTLQPLGASEPRADSHALESVGRLAGELAHDINNQLSAALNYVFILRRRIAEEPLTSHLEELQAAIWRASGLTSALKTIARKRRQPEHLQLAHVMIDLEPLLRYVAGDIRLQVRVPRDLPGVDAPLAYFEQVIITIALFLIARAPSDSVLKLSAQAVEPTGDAAAGAAARTRIVFELLCDGERTNTRPNANGHRTHSGLRRALKRCNARLGHDANRVWVQF